MLTQSPDVRREAFVEVLGHLREPLMLVARDGTIVAGNVAAAEALGTSVTELAGAPLDRFCSEPADFAQRLLQTAQTAASLPLRSPDGRRFSCEASLLPPDLFVVRLSGGPDASKRARAFFEMFARLEPFTGGAEHARTELTRTLLSFGMRAVGAMVGGLFLLDESEQTLELVGNVGYREETVERFRLVAMADGLPLTESVRRATPIYLATPAEYAAQFETFARAYPAITENAMACIPLVIDGRCIGTIGLGFRSPWQFSDADRMFLRDFAVQCAQAMVGTRQRNDGTYTLEAERSTSRFERLHAFTGALAQAITPAEVTEAALDAGMAATGARSGGLWLVNEDGVSVALVRSVGPTGPRPEHHTKVPLDRTPRMPILDAIQTRTPVWIESCAQLEQRYPEIFRAFSQGGESSLACVPLLAQGRCIGGVAYNYDRTHDFHPDDRAFFQVISWYAAQALERARLYAAEKHARGLAEAAQRRSAFLAESDALLSSLDYQATLDAIATIAVPRVADWCVVELADTRARGLPPVAAHRDPAKRATVLALTERLRSRGDHERGTLAVMRTGKSQLYKAVAFETLRAFSPELVALWAEVGLTSSMVVPISARGETLGAIVLNSADPERTYDELDLAMAEELGRKVGLAIENSVLYRDVREADRLKDEFLAMLSHELRNPLVPIVAAVDLMGLYDGELFAQERGLIRRNVHHLVRLVDDLLDVSRITRGKILLQKEPCEISDLIAEAVDIAYPLIEERDQRLMLTVPRRGLAVLTDRVRIVQAIANILTNASKYTEKRGSIAVTAKVESDQAMITIVDTGIGIAPAVLPRIFDMFVQASGAMDRAEGGLGIGLTVVKNVVEMHGGTVFAHSPGLGHGTQIILRLPLDALAEHREYAPPSNRLPPLGGTRVLVVDDNRDAALVISELMHAVGFSTQIAHDGFAALAAAVDFRPDLALLDLGLPTMDGYELARRLRQLFPALRIVAVSGYSQDTDRARSRDAGFDEHLAKPLDLTTLRELVASFRVS